MINTINIKIDNTIFICKLIEIKKFYGDYGRFEVYYKDKLKTYVNVYLDNRFNINDSLIYKLKEDRIIKGILTRNFNKESQLRRLNKLIEVKTI